MTLVEEFSSLPEPRNGWVSLGRTRQGEVLLIGKVPRLTLGERLRGTYRVFYQVDLRSTTITRVIEPRSATGRLKFRVTLSVDLRVIDPVRLVAEELDPAMVVIRPLELSVIDCADEYDVRDYQSLQRDLRRRLDPSLRIKEPSAAFLVERVSITVEADEKVALVPDQVALLQNLELQIASAKAEGNLLRSQNLTGALQSLTEARNRTQRGVLVGADLALELQERYNKMLDAGLSPDEPIMKDIRAQMDSIVRLTSETLQEPSPIGQRPAPKALPDSSKD
jgi:hypothetical protein